MCAEVEVDAKHSTVKTNLISRARLETLASQAIFPKGQHCNPPLAHKHRSKLFETTSYTSLVSDRGGSLRTRPSIRVMLPQALDLRPFAQCVHSSTWVSD